MDELEMYSEYLQWRGFRVEVSDNGADAFAKAIAVRPDVVCASLVLAERDGAELCAALHADERTRHIPVIVLTTLTGDADLAKARTSGCNALLIKPCLPEVIAAEATRLIDAARVRRSPRAVSGHGETLNGPAEESIRNGRPRPQGGTEAGGVRSAGKGETAD
jgi:CheY-like chemotaxis protein